MCLSLTMSGQSGKFNSFSVSQSKLKTFNKITAIIICHFNIKSWKRKSFLWILPLFNNMKEKIKNSKPHGVNSVSIDVTFIFFWVRILLKDHYWQQWIIAWNACTFYYRCFMLTLLYFVNFTFLFIGQMELQKLKRK